MFTLVGLVGSAVTNLIGGLADHFKNKRELKNAEVASRLRIQEAVTQANIDRAAAGQFADIEWSQTMAEASKDSWKDEWFTLVLSIPAIMSFVPGLADYVELGFHALSTTPEWYQLALLVAIGASFGVRIWERIKPGSDGK